MLITDPVTLITELKSLQRQGYIFRGQSDATFYLTPNAFRVKKHKEPSDNFPTKREIEENWFTARAIRDFIRIWTPGANLKEIEHLIQLLKSLVAFIMQYNYNLHRFLEEHPNSVSPKHKEMIELRPQSFWLEKETFSYFFCGYYPSLWKITTKDRVVHHQPLPEDLVAVDETLPQHYGVPTAALDWTHDFYIAIFFAITSKVLGRHFSIYALKMIDSSVSPPISIAKPCIDVKNPRAALQKGVFTYFKKPCSFYMENNRFPSIEDYAHGGTFELMKLDMLCNEANLNDLSDLLGKRNITEGTLGLTDVTI